MFKKVNLLLILLSITTSGLHSSQNASNRETTDCTFTLHEDDQSVPDLKKRRVDSDDIEDRSPTYTFNFLALDPYLGEHSFTYPFKSKYKSEKNILSLLYKTAATMAKHKGSVNLWIDSEVTSHEVIDYFSQKFTSYGIQNPYYAPILIHDIRSLEQVKKTPEVFSSDFPKKFRSDLLRIIATLETLKKGKESYFVYSDLTLVKPLRHEKLFTPKVRKFLDIYGVVFKGIHTEEEDMLLDNISFENTFHIVKKDDEDTRKALQHVVVDLNIVRAQTVSPAQRKELKYYADDSYIAMLDYLQSLKGLGILINKTTNQPYDKDRDGFAPYVIVPNGSGNSFILDYKLSLKVDEAACKQSFGRDYPPFPVTFKPNYHADYLNE